MSGSPELSSSDHHLALSTIIPIKIILPAAALLSTLLLILLIIYFRLKNQNDSLSSSRPALNSDVLKTLPITVVSSTKSDCAICLAEITEKELGRLLTGCSHVFHLDCIDEWFRVNSTCPICRSSVVPTVVLVMDAGNKGVKRGTLPRPENSARAVVVESSAFGRGRAEERGLPEMIV